MRRRSILIFGLIIVLAAALRLYHLSSVPPSLNWDEASVGYNAYSLATTGSDEYGRRFPLSIRSFNDYKPPLYTYSTAAVMAFLGKTEFAVRFTSALAGILTVVLTYFLVRKLISLHSTTNHLSRVSITTNPSNLSNSSNLTNFLSLCTSLFLAILPWHIHFSRIAFEASLALFFFLLGLTFLLKFQKRPNPLLILIGTLSLVLSIYTHHSVKLFLPIFMGIFVLLNFRQFFRRYLLLIPAVILGIFLLLPLIRNVLYSSSQASRALTVSVFAPPNQFHFQGKTLPQVLVENYLSHFDPGFLLLGKGDNPRHHAPNSGPLLLVTIPLFLVGIIYLVFKSPKSPKFPNNKFLLIFWFFLSPLPAIFAIDNPHASRSFLQIPIYSLLIALGLQFLIKKIPHRISPIPPISLISLIFIANLFYYFHQYFKVLPTVDGLAWQYGYKEVVNNVKLLENNYQNIYVTTAYDQPYIYFLFYGNSNPWRKNDGTFSTGFSKYKFTNFKSMSFSEFTSIPQDTLLVLAPNEFPSHIKTLKSIHFPDGKLAFQIAQRL